MIHPRTDRPLGAKRLMLLPLCLFLPSLAFAQQVSEPPAAADPLARYDHDGNGRLDENEQAAMRAEQDRMAHRVPISERRATPDDAAITLSPFEVNASKDQGYAATNALSGTRLNSSLEDIPAAVSVVTKQQLMDTVAIDLNDIFMYEANTEGIYQYTELTTDARAGVVDQASHHPETANRIRGIGAANMAVNGFAMNSALPVDTYNIKQVEISRGPNSNLFGIGQVAGTVNLIRDGADATRQWTHVDGSVSSWGGRRGAINFNRPLLGSTVGLYVAGVHDEKGFSRKPSFDKTDRIYLAGVWQPTRLTKLTASFENYKNAYSRPNYTTPREVISNWRTNGSPTWDPVTWTAKKNGVSVGTFANTTAGNNALAPLGLTYEASGAARPNWFIIDGEIQAYTQGVGGPANNQRLAEPAWPTYPVLYQAPGTTDASLYDWRHDSLTGANYGEKRGKTYQVQLEQFILEPSKTKHHTLAAQIGWQRQDVKDWNRSYLGYSDGAPLAVEIDVNERLPDGSPNPGFLRPYFNSTLPPQRFERPNLSDHLRGTVAYQLDLSQEESWLKWLGRHTLAAYGEYRDTKSGTIRYRDQVTSQHSWIGTTGYPNNALTAITTRYYLGDASSQSINGVTGSPDPGLGTFTMRRWDAASSQWTTDDVTIESVYLTGSQLQHQIRSQGGVWQGHLWGDRIVPTIGIREDRSRSRWNAPLTASNPLGYMTEDDLANLHNFDTDWNVVNPVTGATEVSGRTTTKGVVLKPLDWLHLSYNESDSFQPAGYALDPLGNVLPNPTGTGEDYGVRLLLFNNKLSIRYGRYENFSKDSRFGTANIFAERMVGFDFDARINWRWDLETFVTDWVNQLHPDWTEDRRRSEVLGMMGLDGEQMNRVKNYALGATNDVHAKGHELEIVYNPTRFWTMKLTGAEQVSINSNMAGSILEYYESRKDVWENIRVPTDLKPDGTQLANAGQRWWDLSSLGAPISTWFNNVVWAPYKLESALQGKPRPQVRRYRMNFTTDFRLAGLTDRDHLKNMAIGGAVRWEDKASIGFAAGTPDADGIVRELDASKPFYDKDHTYVDLWWKYHFQLRDAGIRGRLQLNVRNAFESGRLQGVAANPDGQVWAWRIVDPRQFILSLSFDL